MDARGFPTYVLPGINPPIVAERTDHGVRTVYFEIVIQIPGVHLHAARRAGTPEHSAAAAVGRVRHHAKGMQQGRPDENFGDPTGSVELYRSLCEAGSDMSVYPRDPLPPAAAGIVDAVFATYPPGADFVTSYSAVCNFLRLALPQPCGLRFRQ